MLTKFLLDFDYFFFNFRKLFAKLGKVGIAGWMSNLVGKFVVLLGTGMVLENASLWCKKKVDVLFVQRIFNIFVYGAFDIFALDRAIMNTAKSVDGKLWDGEEPLRYGR